MSERIRIIKFLKGQKSVLALTALLAFISGCNSITEVDPAKSINRSVSNYGDSGDALIYTETPTELTGNTYSYGTSNAQSFLSSTFTSHLTRDFVTSNTYLETTCGLTQYYSSSASIATSTSQNCFQILNDEDPATQLIQAVNGSWKFTADSDEFYQVNLYYHINKIKERYLDSLSFAHQQVHFNSTLTLPPATKHNFVNTQSYWLTNSGTTSTLRAYANIPMARDEINAYYSPSTNVLAFGYTEDEFDGFKFVQDPTVIYHEFGHALVKIMMNQRNVTYNENTFSLSSHPYQSDLGASFYDEAGSINEGIADYFSYYMNNRTEVGDWAFSVLAGGHRPLTEDDDHHSADVSSNAGEKLSYPQFLLYNPNSTEYNEEDVHNAGQIITHYLVNLTETFKTTCSISTTDEDEIHELATNYVMLLLNETLAEIGDLTGKGSDYFSDEAGSYNSNHESVFFTNLNSDQSFLWTHFVNPPTFRRFFKIFGKNIVHHISSNLCTEFSVDNSEELLDEYGLLLFTSYEDTGNGYDTATDTSQFFYSFVSPFNATNEAWAFSGVELSPLLSNTEVNENNRRNTVLVSKEYLTLDETAPSILFDGQTEIASILSELTFQGENVTTTSGIAGTEYNNANLKISPGEVVGLSLNIFNNSNSTMAGVQVLANDWDHMRLKMDVEETYEDSETYVNSIINSAGLNSGDIAGETAIHEPCIIDDFPKASEGGVTDSTSTTKGNCSSYSKENYQLDLSTVVSDVTYAKYELDAPQPVCLVQYNDDNETKWVSQDFYRKYKLDLEDPKCLNNPSMSGNSFNPNECMIRVLPGASTSTFSKINAQSTWSETMKEDSDLKVEYNSSGLFLMEINKWIQPGTKFNCRFRVRHSNCTDCFNSSSGVEYKDYQFTGPTPFKVIDFQFTVLD